MQEYCWLRWCDNIKLVKRNQVEGKDPTNGTQMEVNTCNFCKCTLKLPLKFFMNLTNINEIEYMLSQDPKSSNLVISITIHSSKYHYPYGECYKDYKSNEWYKG